jgi:phage host-nuclease inhibitor protein Gam
MDEENAMDINKIIATAEALAPASPLRAGPPPPDLDSYEDTENPEVRGPWKIETITSADWALARMAELQAEADSIDEQAQKAKERIDARAASLKERIARGLGYFRYKLLEYAETHKATLLGGGKKKSRTFLHGTLGWRRRGGKLVVKEPDALRAWLVTQPVESGLYRMKVEPEMVELQRRFKEHGECPPGCDAEPDIDEPYVKVEVPEEGLVKP